MSLPFDHDQLREILTGCVRRTGLRSAYVAMLCTRGRPPQGSRDLRQCRNRFLAYAIPFIWIGGQERQADGISAIISAVTRIPPESVDPTVKNYHWLDLEQAIFICQEFLPQQPGHMSGHIVYGQALFEPIAGTKEEEVGGTE